MSLLADIDTGYGNAVSAYFATEAFEAAGVAGIMIEDQVWPKRCGHMAGKELIGAEEMAMKVRSACAEREGIRSSSSGREPTRSPPTESTRRSGGQS